jgi:23S rRNA G2445 N2-methylase RlmL
LLERQKEILAHPTLAHVFERATLRAARDVQRDAQPTRGIDAEVPVSAEVWLTCRKGLEVLLADELRAWGGRVKAPGVVSASLDGTPRASLAALFAARLWLDFAFPLPQAASGDGADAIVTAMQSDTARTLLSTLSRGSATYRIAWEDGRHRRAETYALVQRLREVVPELLNDPRGSTWEIRVRTGRTPEVLLAPQAMQDTRFAYRRGDVPAASHPTLAAALAMVAQPSSNDVIWDPFVGSGTELRECATRGAYARLCGSDHDESALRTAAANLEGLDRVTLRAADCLDAPPRGVTLIISNPPMGRRVERHEGLLPMLEAFLQHAYHHLPGGGRLVWLAPSPGRLRPAGVRVGFALTYARAVDMGGFEVELQAWRKP